MESEWGRPPLRTGGYDFMLQLDARRCSVRPCISRSTSVPVTLTRSPTCDFIADGICQIGVFARHVTLAFPRGVDFHDPAGILEGSGKRMRHIRVKRLSDLDRPEIRAFLRQARRRAGLKRRRGDAGGEVVTRVKQTPRGIV
ncbi:MAG: hypothetical protein DMG03_12750 [Acidobacteria bacterium]|nr:MAG: hypothetical protein DMG03_12750 [Acidobacteriota bacterium]